jgi:pimeloyl-ACP methyl ester carboxylesterase
MRMTERMVRADGVELASEAFGDPADPPLLLIMGVMASMLWWPDEFCERLASLQRRVVRYDNRDTGRSTTYEPGSPGYTLEELADDATRVLDAYRLPTAHLVGMSLGGQIAQLVSLKYPARVRTLTLISSSPLGRDNRKLPGPTPSYLKHSAKFAKVDFADKAQATSFLLEDSRMLSGSAHPFDAARAARLIERDYERAKNFASATNHTLIKAGARGKLEQIEVPLLVIHGTKDPIFPLEHGIASSKAVAGASLVKLEGSGHELNEADWDEIIAVIISHTGERRASSAAGGAQALSRTSTK